MAQKQKFFFLFPSNGDEEWEGAHDAHGDLGADACSSRGPLHKVWQDHGTSISLDDHGVVLTSAGT